MKLWRAGDAFTVLAFNAIQGNKRAWEIVKYLGVTSLDNGVTDSIDYKIEEELEQI